ncbi:MAG: shikimate dehydrogenase [Dehalococcoidia bacterium]|jgi:shikimate dehydrogenase
MTDTVTCCLIGDPVAHSLSPAIHNAAYKALGLNYRYIAMRAADIGPALAVVRERGLRGASITTPHKTAARKYLDRVDPAAEAIGAVNTVVNDNGVLTGYNTDGIGALKALEEVTEVGGKRVVLIGSGGAASAIAAALMESGADLAILNRTLDKARHLANKVRAADSGGLDRLTFLNSADILINATTVGMTNTGQTIVPQSFLHPRLTVFDIVYSPRETRLLREAGEKGCTIVYGYKMLLYQAAEQFRLFTGQDAPLEVMESALVAALGGGTYATHTDRR